MKLILAAEVWNFKRRLNLWCTKAILLWILFYEFSTKGVPYFFAPKLKPGAEGQLLNI